MRLYLIIYIVYRFIFNGIVCWLNCKFYWELSKLLVYVIVILFNVVNLYKLDVEGVVIYVFCVYNIIEIMF